MGTPRSAERRDTVLLAVSDDPPVPLLYWEDEGSVYVVSSGHPAWTRHLSDGASANLIRPGGAREARYARWVTSAETRARVEAEFRAKYGHEVWLRYFAGEHLTIRLGTEATTPAADRFDRVRAEFDGAAEWYTARIEGDAVERELRERSRSWLNQVFVRRDPLLEIGPGTGLETLALLAAGHHVTAVDISPEMMDRLKARVKAAGFGDRFEGRVGRLASIGKDLEDVPDGHFAGAYSTFGAFNLEPTLDSAGRGLARLLRTGAPVALGVLSPSGLAPLAYALARNDPREMRARLSNPIPAGGIRYDLDVVPRAPARLAESLGPYFRFRSTRAASVILPSRDYPRLRTGLGDQGWKLFVDLDRTLRRLPGTGWLSEWAFVELVRVA